MLHLLSSSCFVGLAVPCIKSVLVLTGACRGVSQGVGTGPRALGHHYLPQLADLESDQCYGPPASACA